VNLVPLLVPLLLPDWLDPAYLIQSMGNWALWGVALILIVECSIFPILPGDSLLFTVGMFIAMTPPSITFAGMDKPMVLAVCCVILTIAAVLGNVIGYWVGKAIGPTLFKPRTGFWGKVFDPKRVDQTHALLEKYGPRALILARFVPFARTFITLIAGIGGMTFRKFMTYTGIGAVIWAVGVTVLGYFLGTIPVINNNLEFVLILIVVVSVLPMVFEYLNERRKLKAEAAEQA
jgi:membrane-associated protein